MDDEQVRFIRSAYAEALASGREANAKHPQAKAAKLVRRFTCDADDILRFTAIPRSGSPTARVNAT